MGSDFIEQMPQTKREIFFAALELFSNNGYHEASMSQIADAVGISPGAIYNYFSSKDVILQQIYRYFQHCISTFYPTPDMLYEYLETHSPKDTLWQIVNVFPDDIAKQMHTILAIAASMPNDIRAQMLISNYFFRNPAYLLSCLLDGMLERDLIEPVDIDSLCFLYTSVCHSMTLRIHVGGTDEEKHFIAAVDYVFSLIHEKAPIKKAP